MQFLMVQKTKTIKLVSALLSLVLPNGKYSRVVLFLRAGDILL